jgi:hypothetical protein
MNSSEYKVMAQRADEFGQVVLAFALDIYTGEVLVVTSIAEVGEGDEHQCCQVWSYTNPAGFYNAMAGDDKPPKRQSYADALAQFGRECGG